MICLRGLEVQGSEPGYAGGLQIGGDRLASLSRSGDNQTLSVVWLAVTPGAHRVNVVVDLDGQVD